MRIVTEVRRFWNVPKHLSTRGKISKRCFDKNIRAINFLKHSKVIAVKNIDIVFSSNYLLCSQHKTRNVFAETSETKEDESSTAAPIAVLN